MIQEAFNFMTAILLARFILNDVPHAVGLTSNPRKQTIWVAISPYSWGGTYKESAAKKSYRVESVSEAIELAKKDAYFMPYFDKIKAAGYKRMSFSWGAREQWAHRHSTASFDVPPAG